MDKYILSFDPPFQMSTWLQCFFLVLSTSIHVRKWCFISLSLYGFEVDKGVMYSCIQVFNSRSKVYVYSDRFILIDILAFV